MRENSATDSHDTTIPTDGATTWRDLVPHLTEKQIESFETAEQRPDSTADELLEWAREITRGNAEDAELDASLAHVALPIGATSGGKWDNIDVKSGLVCRSIQWAEFDAGPNSVDVDGWQDAAGAVDGPHVSVYGLEDGGKLTAGGARELAAALAKAAEVAEQLDGQSAPAKGAVQ